MSMLLSLCSILSTALNTGQCAPKLGHVLFDPLLYEANVKSKSNELTSNQENLPKENLRIPPIVEFTSKSPCLGYDYDKTICKTVDDRVLCGYNKNKGNSSSKIINLGNDCRIRGDRLECGYFKGPFNARRPPATDEVVHSNNKTVNLLYGTTGTSHILSKITVKQHSYDFNYTTQKQTERLKLNSKTTNNTHIVILNTSSTTSSTLRTSLINNSSFPTASNITTTTRTPSKDTKSKKYCVDKNDRIFCHVILSNKDKVNKTL